MTWAAPLFRAGGISAHCLRGCHGAGGGGTPTPHRIAQDARYALFGYRSHPWRFLAVFRALERPTAALRRIREGHAGGDALGDAR